MKNWAVIPKSHHEELLHRVAKLTALVRELRDRLHDERDLLTIALHQLAERDRADDHQAYARRWLARERSAWLRDPVPVSHASSKKEARSPQA